jgi:hypothetical protein
MRSAPHILLVRFAAGLLLCVLLLSAAPARAASVGDRPPAPSLPGSLSAAYPLAPASLQASVAPWFVVNQADNIKRSPTVAHNWHEAEYLVAWEVDESPGGIVGQRVTSGGQLFDDPFFIASVPPGGAVSDLALAYDWEHQRYLAVWTQSYGTSQYIYGRILPGGDPASGFPPFMISTSGPAQAPSQPDVAYGSGPDAYMVVWTRGGSALEVRLVRYDGTLPSAPVTLPRPAGDTDARNLPDIAYNWSIINEFAVVYDVSHTNPAPGHRVAGMRVSASGSPVGSEFSVTAVDPNWTWPRLATCGQGYAVVYQKLIDHDEDIYLQFLSQLGANQGGPIVVQGTTGSEAMPDVVCGSRQQRYLVAWEQGYNTGYFGISGRLVASDGSGGPNLVFVEPGANIDRRAPALASDAPPVWTAGYGYLVAWQHQRGGSGGYYYDIYGRLLFDSSSYLPIVSTH